MELAAAPADLAKEALGAAREALEVLAPMREAKCPLNGREEPPRTRRCLEDELVGLTGGGMLPWGAL